MVSVQALKRIPTWLRLLLVLALLAGIGGALSVLPAGMIAVKPHEPIDLEGKLRIGGQKPEPAHGHLFLVGVAEQRVTWMQRFIYSFDPAVTLQPEPTSSTTRIQQERDQHAVVQSKQVAAAVAWDMLGVPVSITGRGAFVTHVDDEGPSARVLKPGDRIVRINGRNVTTSLDVTRTIAALPPGSRVELGVRRDNLPRIVRIRTVPPREGDTLHRSRIGIAVNTPNLRIKLPRRVQFTTGDVIGPSAGLPFALAVYDAESPEDLLRGRYVVATGALSLEGEVLRVGGVRQKAIATQRAGHDILVVPRSNEREAVDAIREACVEGAECSRVLAVRSVREAVDLLKLDSRDLESKFAN